MKNFRDYNRSQRLLLPPDPKDWVQEMREGMMIWRIFTCRIALSENRFPLFGAMLFIVEAARHVDMSAFHVSRTGSGKAEYHPRMMPALLVYCTASGIFSSRRIEQATYRKA